MKKVLSVLVLLLGLTSFAQEESTCGQLPYAKVDQKAELTMKLDELIKKDLPSTLREDGEQTAVFKMYVDCHGEVAKYKVERSTMTDADQKWLWKLIGKTTWKAAKLDKNTVTSLVFITVTVTNGQVEVLVQ